MRVFLDANVLFSASNVGSNIARLIDMLLEKGEAISSDLACEEARRNTILKRPAWSQRLEEILNRVVVVPTAVFPLPIKLDGKDVPLLCAAIRASCQYFVTGDQRDFGHLYDHTVGGVTVISLRRLAELLTGSSPEAED